MELFFLKERKLESTSFKIIGYLTCIWLLILDDLRNYHTSILIGLVPLKIDVYCVCSSHCLRSLENHRYMTRLLILYSNELHRCLLVFLLMSQASYMIEQSWFVLGEVRSPWDQVFLSYISDLLSSLNFKIFNVLIILAASIKVLEKWRTNVDTLLSQDWPVLKLRLFINLK